MPFVDEVICKSLVVINKALYSLFHGLLYGLYSIEVTNLVMISVWGGATFMDEFAGVRA